MNMKPALLVAALAAAAAVTVGCEQRGASDTVGKRDTSSGSMQAQNAPGKDTGSMQAQNTPPGGASTAPSTGSSMSEKTNTAADKIGGVADDAAITAKVKAAILAEPGLKSLKINVDTKDATVTLSGNVDSDNLRDRAKQIAMSTEGVKNVVDNLTVKAG
jgi:hyperosmotically inducible protein